MSLNKRLSAPSLFIGILCLVVGLVSVFLFGWADRLNKGDQSIQALNPSAVLEDRELVTTGETIVAPKEEDLSCWGDIESNPKFGPIKLAPDRILRTVCGNLFVSDASGNLIWQKSVGTPLTDEPKVVGTELVVIGNDLHLSGLDFENGDENWHFSTNGKAFYSQLKVFRDGMFIVVVDMSAYDTGYQLCVGEDFANADSCPRTEADQLRIHLKQDLVKVSRIPPNSSVKVIRGKIFVTSVNRGKKVRRELPLGYCHVTKGKFHCTDPTERN